MLRLRNTIQPYAWGSPTAIPSLLGRPPDGTPQAELWLGAHPSAPSSTERGPLDAVIRERPEAMLGARVTQHFGAQLPFLLKVLAAAQPLSLQAHPSLEQAQAGYAREEAAGTPRSAAHRNYKDANHKPEVICALTEFHALCGFRRVSDTVRLFSALGLDVRRLQQDGLRAYFEQLMTLGKTAQRNLVEVVVSGAARGVPGFEGECALAQQLSQRYPGDVGIVGALLLNLVTLQPGDALYLGAGNLHAYLEGTGIELMANSDNVLRGGLTPKHVDVPELLSVLEFEDGPARVLRPTGEVEAVYETPAPDFRLSRLTLTGATFTLPSRGPQILLVTDGELEVGAETLKRGDSVFFGADETVTLSGRGTAFRATPGL